MLCLAGDSVPRIKLSYLLWRRQNFDRGYVRVEHARRGLVCLADHGLSRARSERCRCMLMLSPKVHKLISRRRKYLLLITLLRRSPELLRAAAIPRLILLACPPKLHLLISFTCTVRGLSRCLIRL